MEQALCAQIDQKHRYINCLLQPSWDSNLERLVGSWLLYLSSEPKFTPIATSFSFPIDLKLISIVCVFGWRLKHKQKSCLIVKMLTRLPKNWGRTISKARRQINKDNYKPRRCGSVGRASALQKDPGPSATESYWREFESQERLSFTDQAKA